MKETAKICVDLPGKEHIFMKIECAKKKIALRDFVREMVLEQWEKYKTEKNIDFESLYK